MYLIKSFIACRIEGCNEARYCKGFCVRHYQQSRRKSGIMAEEEQVTSMRSICCDAAVTQGPAHEFGKQYCSACSDPCFWRVISALES